MEEPWVLGIEIGGTKLQLGIGHGQGSLIALERLRVDPSRGAPGILDQIQAAYPILLDRVNLRPHQIQAVGIGFGGPVNAPRGRTQTSYQVGGWDDFPLGSWIAGHLDVRQVIVENDADSAGLAEARFGAGVGHSPILYMNVGSGIGGALIVGQQIYRGFGQGAAEVGHLRVIDVTASGPRIRELEQVASGWAIAAAGQDRARALLHQKQDDWVVLRQAQGDPDKINAIMIAQEALKGDPESSAILDRARTAVAFALAQAITLLAPRRVVLGGGVSLVGEAAWFDPIRRLVERDVFQPFLGHFDIAPAALGEEVVVHGALALARDVISTTS
jgi:glucokinase